MKTTFRLHVMENGAVYPTFEEAFVAFFRAIVEMVSRGTSYQALETFCWIEGTFEIDGKSVSAPLYYYDARDFAYDAGILVEVEGSKMPAIANPLPKIPSTDILALFVRSELGELEALARLKAEVEQLFVDKADQGGVVTT